MIFNIGIYIAIRAIRLLDVNVSCLPKANIFYYYYFSK